MHCLNEQFTALSSFRQLEYSFKIKNNKRKGEGNNETGTSFTISVHFVDAKT